MAIVRPFRGVVVFHGQRKAKRHHTCDRCERPICSGEYYWCKHVLGIDRVMFSVRYCCKVIP